MAQIRDTAYIVSIVGLIVASFSTLGIAPTLVSMMLLFYFNFDKFFAKEFSSSFYLEADTDNEADKIKEPPDANNIINNIDELFDRSDSEDFCVIECEISFPS